MNWAEIELSPIRERVEWAGRHVERMRKLLAAYVASRPVYVGLSKSPDGAQVIETAELTSLPPMQLSLVLGDIAHHLRASLDNLAGSFRTGGPTRTSGFPISLDPDKFEREAAQKLAGVPTWAIASIRGLQPFANNESWHVGKRLYSIDQIAQRDRHRALLLHAPILHSQPILHGRIGDVPSAPIPLELYNLGPTSTRVAYPVGALIRTEYSVRVVVAEDTEGVLNQEIMSVAEQWMEALRQVVSTMEDAIDQAWASGETRA